MTDKIPREISDLRSRYEWKKVTAPKAWRPKHNGEELVGFYGGKSVRTGQYGEYTTILVHVPKRGSFSISGTRIVQLVHAADIDVGWPIRIVWLGTVKVGDPDDDHQMKNFDVFVAEGDPVSPDELPKMQDATPERTDG